MICVRNLYAFVSRANKNMRLDSSQPYLFKLQSSDSLEFMFFSEKHEKPKLEFNIELFVQVFEQCSV